MNKKIIGIILSVIVLSAVILTTLSMCSSDSDDNDDHYTVLQWLDKVENTFNLLYYSEKEPLIKSVKTDDENFEIIQIAAEWGIINPNDDLDFSECLTKEFAADTLIRAMNCVSASKTDISDSDSIDPLYLENVMSAVSEGIFSLQSGKFHPKEKLTVDEANTAMMIARDKWVNFSYGGKSFDRSVIKENVINFGGVADENSPVVSFDYSVKYLGDKTFFDDDGGYTDNTNKIITFPSGQIPIGMEVGSVLAMPADDIIPMNYAVIVTSIDYNDDGSATIYTRSAALEDVYEEIDIQQSETVDFSDAVFYGPDGQRLYFDDHIDTASVLNTSSSSIEPDFLKNTCYEGLALSETSYLNSKLSNADRSMVYTKSGSSKKSSSTIKLGDGLSLTMYKSNDGSSVGFKIEGEVKDGNENVAVEIGFDETIKIENRIRTHWDWFRLKVDELRLSLTDTKTETFGFSCSAVNNFGETINKVKDRDGDGKWNIGDWSSEAHKLRKIYGETQSVGKSFKSLAAKAKSAANKKLVDIIIPGSHLHFVVRAELDVDGSLKLTLTQSNTYGVELMNGKLRAIHENSDSKYLDFSAKVELIIRAALEFQLIGINVADIGLKAGVGAKASSIIYSFDKSSDTLLEVFGMEGAAVKPGTTASLNDDTKIAENGLPIETDDTRTDRICLEVRVYPILTVFGCSSSSVAGKLFGGIELELLGSNTPFFKVHYEFNENGGGVVSECLISANDSYGITTGDKLSLNVNDYVIGVGGDADTGLAVLTVPKDTSIKDINITSDNTDVLEAENLLHKVTEKGFVSFSPSIKITGAAAEMFAKASKSASDYKFGTWFYQDISENPKPQFALTGKKNGMANVTITVGGESITIPVQVGTGEEGIVSSGALISSKGTFTLSVGETAQTAFEFIPEGKTIDDIVFSSADNTIASVSSKGLVTAVGEGSTTVTATLRGQDKEFSTVFTIHVIS